jgi:MFS family permease
MSQRPKLQASAWINRTVIGIGLASLFSDLGHETVTSVLPAYLAGMGAAAGALGTVEGFADGFSSFAKLYGGWLSDRLRRRKPLCATGYMVMGLSPFLIAGALSWPVVALGRSLAWISRGIRTPARKTLLADAVPAGAYGRAYGLERAMDTCGAILAPLAVILFLGLGASHRQVILMSAMPALLAALAILFLVKEKPRPPMAHPLPFWKGFSGFDKTFKEYLAAVGLFGLGDFADTFYILYAVSVLSPSKGAAQAATWSVGLYAIHNIFYASFSYGGGWLADHFPKRLVLIAGYLCAAAAAAFMAFGAQGITALFLIFALGGMGVGLYETGEDALAAELLPSERRGRGFGALAVTTGLGDWFSSLGVGWLWAFFGLKIAFGGAVALMLAGVVLMSVLQVRHAKKI